MTDAQGGERRSFVTVEIGEQLFGIAIGRVREVFAPERLTRVPLSAREIAGVLNLRGRIVTAIDMRSRLGMAPAPAGSKNMAIGVDHRGEAFALLVDRPGDVVDLDVAGLEPAPATLDRRWASLVEGVFRLDDRLLLILDVDRALAASAEPVAA
ncbi:chemotaxis protein CheW [Chenggangzhangella methanolivorans]|uniref:Chemotaxis protein CheW n=1 Tax=Chenggangzhangella methanolivorans TaxID=1437009 RepID=A0A9E6RDS7_9HYPH|nr:chemotaxis protein CheW [Chenggangzhangella methanolivorans]QZN99255.1 chemotaxis protein CheW [Chenggangzhangella methanolivorans]